MMGIETGGLNEKEQRALRALEVKLEADRLKTAEAMAKKGKFKIQVWFKSQRSTWKPMAWTLSIWESGKRLHGGGDEMLFFCKRQPDAPRQAAMPMGLLGGGKVAPGPDGCGNIISGEMLSGTKVLCPHCMLQWETTHVGDSIYYYTTAQKAAEIIEDWWMKLGCDADLYFKHRPDDPRTLMMSRAYSAKTAREKKGLVIYPLANIIRDSEGGASVQNLFRNLITA